MWALFGSRYTPPPRDPSFLGLSPDPEVTEQKKLWCTPFSWKKKENGIHHRSGKRVYTIEPQTRKKKRRGSPRWCILFSSLLQLTLTFFTQISGRNFLPELCGEIHPETAPLQDLCCALCSTEQSTFRGGEQGEKVPRKGEEEGWPAEGAKREKGCVKTG